jgi:CheY-like chemotaxis protein
MNTAHMSDEIPTITKKKILIIEDDRALRRVLEFRLGQENYEILTANDGEEGLASVKVNLPDLVLLDLIMPKMNGFEALRRIKEDEAIKHIPVIILSNLNQDSDLAMAQELGAAEFFLKIDFSIDKVVEGVRRILGT